MFLQKRKQTRNLFKKFPVNAISAKTFEEVFPKKLQILHVFQLSFVKQLLSVSFSKNKMLIRTQLSVA